MTRVRMANRIADARRILTCLSSLLTYTPRPEDVIHNLRVRHRSVAAICRGDRRLFKGDACRSCPKKGTAMSRRCELTGKAVLGGHLVSHSNRKTKRVFARPTSLRGDFAIGSARTFRATSRKRQCAAFGRAPRRPRCLPRQGLGSGALAQCPRLEARDREEGGAGLKSRPGGFAPERRRAIQPLFSPNA